MIDQEISYANNIEKEDSKHYKLLVDKLVDTGEMDAKYTLLMDSNDISNIILLSLLKIRDLPEDRMVRDARGYALYHKKEFNILNVDKLFGSLNQEYKERICYALGLNIIITLGLDELPEFAHAMHILTTRLNGPPKAIIATEEDEYAKSPKLCTLCQSPNPFNRREKKFCTTKCASAFYNKRCLK